jgi:cytochrome b561
MIFRKQPERYGGVAQFFHWAVVVLICFQYTWAWRIDQTEGIRARFELVTQHKTIGMLVLAFAVLRLLWRLFHAPPPLPKHLANWEIWAAKLGHLALYGLIFIGDYWWGPVVLPVFIEATEASETLFYQLHELFGKLLIAVVVIHVLAALRHHFILKDNVLKRMLPQWRQ